MPHYLIIVRFSFSHPVNKSGVQRIEGIGTASGVVVRAKRRNIGSCVVKIYIQCGVLIKVAKIDGDTPCYHDEVVNSYFFFCSGRDFFNSTVAKIILNDRYFLIGNYRLPKANNFDGVGQQSECR